MQAVPILRGNQVTLRPLQPETDAPAWFVVMQDEAMHQWTGNTVPANVGEVKELLTLYQTHDDLIAWAVVDNEKGHIIGTYWIRKPVRADLVTLIPDEAQRFSRACWRKGHAKDARRLVYAYAFESLQVEEIHAHAWMRNVNSCRSMEKAGFQLVSTTLREFPKKQERYLERHYRLTREAWYGNLLRV